MSSVSRRSFFGFMGAGAGALVASACSQSLSTTAPLDSFYTKVSLGVNANGQGFGPLIPRLPENLDELADLRRERLAQELLALPEGFKYTAISITGQRMSDRTLVPFLHDGMACFSGVGDRYILVRNHEVPSYSPLGIVRTSVPRYDAAAYGGTTTVIVDGEGRVRRDFVSLAGTVRNCAGGPTPWRSWLSCEEPGTTSANPRFNEKHGYVFEVPAGSASIADPTPLRAMGRFNHEAVAVDPDTGYVYETEDFGEGSFYRFIPDVPGDLKSGGKLEALRIVGSTEPIETSTAPFAKGEPISVEWVPISEPDPDGTDLTVVAQQAQAQNAAIFRRGEGCWYGNELIYFVCTSGGIAGQGQVWSYDPRQSILTKVVESTSESELDNPDNITVGPDGTLYLCEDGDDVQFVVGVSPAGELFKFAQNLLDEREFAGACFSPDGKKLFFNGQGVGITYCVWREDNRPIML